MTALSSLIFEIVPEIAAPPREFEADPFMHPAPSCRTRVRMEARPNSSMTPTHRNDIKKKDRPENESALTSTGLLMEGTQGPRDRGTPRSCCHSVAAELSAIRPFLSEK